MTITKDEMVEILNQQRSVMPTNMMDNLMKMLVTLSTAGIIALFVNTQDFKQQIAVMAVQQTATVKQLEKFESKIESINDQRLNPIEQRIEGNSYELKRRTDWFDAVDRRIRDIEGRVSKLEQEE